MKAKWTWRGFRLTLKRIYRRIVRASGTPHEVALGVAAGFFIAWLPIVGIQMAVAFVVCTWLKCNRVVPIFPIWLTNPATIVPVFGFNYWVGWQLVGGPGLDEATGAIAGLIPPMAVEGVPFWPNPFRWGYEWMAAFFANVGHNFSALVELGWDLQPALWLGSALVGLALAVPSYYLSRFAVDRFWQRVFHERQRRQERIEAERLTRALSAPEAGSASSDDRS